MSQKTTLAPTKAIEDDKHILAGVDSRRKEEIPLSEEKNKKMVVWESEDKNVLSISKCFKFVELAC